MQVVWLVGASAGIGLAMTESFLKKGYAVVASARQAELNEDLKNLKAQFPQQLCCVDLDVSDTESLPEKILHVWQCFQRIDIWFYNAGAYFQTAYAKAELKDFVLMNQVNYLGCVSIMLALRDALEQKQNHKMRWVWNLSIASQVGLPYGGGYSATKAALLNLAESLQPELAQKQVQLQVINHGFVKTRLTSKNKFEMPGLMTPEQAATIIVDTIEKGDQNFEIHFPKRLTLFLKTLRMLPYSWVFFLTKRMLKDG